MHTSDEVCYLKKGRRVVNTIICREHATIQQSVCCVRRARAAGYEKLHLLCPSRRIFSKIHRRGESDGRMPDLLREHERQNSCDSALWRDRKRAHYVHALLRPPFIQKMPVLSDVVRGKHSKDKRFRLLDISKNYKFDARDTSISGESTAKTSLVHIYILIDVHRKDTIIFAIIDWAG